VRYFIIIKYWVKLVNTDAITSVKKVYRMLKYEFERYSY